MQSLPRGLPEFIPVTLMAEHGQKSWSSQYRLYNNGKPSDYVDVVVSPPRHLRPWPMLGEQWWVKPTDMAVRKRLIFAEVYGRVGGHETPPDVRTGEELLLMFQWSREDRDYRTFYDNWSVVLRGARGICRDEKWRVRIERIDPCSGLIEVSSIGPDPKMLYEPPKKVGLMSVIPFFGSRDVLESDVFSYYQRGRTRGEEFDAEIERNGQIIQIRCSELRRLTIGFDRKGKAIEKIVGFVHGDVRGHLAELVLIEGELAQRPKYANLQEPEEAHRPVGESRVQAELAEDDQAWRDYLDEVRENTEPSDRDEY